MAACYLKITCITDFIFCFTEFILISVGSCFNLLGRKAVQLLILVVNINSSHKYGVRSTPQIR